MPEIPQDITSRIGLQTFPRCTVLRTSCNSTISYVTGQYLLSSCAVLYGDTTRWQLQTHLLQTAMSPAQLLNSRRLTSCFGSPISLRGDLHSSVSGMPPSVETFPKEHSIADIFHSLCLGLCLAMIDASIVATSLYTIGVEFDDVERINWVALAYTLTFLGSAVFFSRMADVVGRRNAFVAAFAIFFSFSLGCGFSQSMNALIACRALQGIGGSGLFSVTMIIFPEVSPPQARNYIAAVIGAVVSISGVLGPVLGGLFTAYTTWRWVFWIK